MGVKQPTIAGMEKNGQDIKLSSLKKYVEAAGGKLNLDIDLSDGSHFLSLGKSGYAGEICSS